MPTDKDLFVAIESNNLNEVKQLIEDEDGISYAHSYDYRSPLLQSVELRQTDIVKYLLSSNYGDVDEGREETCFSPLMLACEKGYAEIAKILLEYGANVNLQYERDDEQGFSLTLAIENGYSGIVRLLLDYKANVECIKWSYRGGWNFNETPLFLAMIENHFENMELLLKYNADIDGECIISSETHTPFSYAVAKNKLEWVKLLLEHGADSKKVIEDGYTVF